MRLVIALLQVMHVVGADERQVEIARERQQPLVDDLLLLDALVLHLEEEVVRAENIAQPPGRIECGTRLFDLQRAGNFPFQAAAEADQPFRMSGEQFLVDARPIVEAFRVAGRHELDQILVAFVGFGEQDQVIRVRLRT